MGTMIWTEENIGEVLDLAMMEGKVVAYYQPKYDAITGKVAGAEALSRWIGEDGKLISPAQFVPLLEKSTEITKLDWHILEEVCRFVRQQMDEDVLMVPISVNFSRMHTHETDYVDRLVQIVDQYEVPHTLIEVEITESALAETGTDVIQFVREIRNAGFSVAIDDFGSGLSSLSFVKNVPANVLKIDKSLLSENCEDEKERVVLESIFSFAQRLKLSTVAEGVETKEQLSFLRTCGCDIIQGYYFAKPMAEDQFAEILHRGESEDPGDILLNQPVSSMTRLLMDAVFMCYPLIILSNLSRNSYFIMSYEDFTNKSCPSTGVYTELIAHAAGTMHPEDQQKFADTFDLQTQLDAQAKGERTRRVVTRQMGDDGIYRRAETTNFYVKSPASDDVLAITLSRNLPDDE